MTDDLRKYAPATQRNREPILEVLQRVLPPTGTVLEVASGTGEHAVFFAPRLSPRGWLPSEINPELRESIEAWRKYSESLGRSPFPCEVLSPPLMLDVQKLPWDLREYTEKIMAIVCINMIHISPIEATYALMAGAKLVLPPQGILYLYGPYKRGGQHTAPSNAAFDQSLRATNPLWGVRNLEEVIEIAQTQNLHHVETVEMPANNLSVIFERVNP